MPSELQAGVLFNFNCSPSEWSVCASQFGITELNHVFGGSYKVICKKPFLLLAACSAQTSDSAACYMLIFKIAVPPLVRSASEP